MTFAIRKQGKLIPLAPSVRRPYSRTLFGWILLASLLLVSCRQKDPNYVDSAALGAIKKVSLADLSSSGHLVYVGSSDMEASKDAVSILQRRDTTSLLQKLNARRVFASMEVLNLAGNNSNYSAALDNPLSADPAVLAELSKKAGADGLLWIFREYRIRATAGLGGEGHAQWEGEVLSRIHLFDATGHLVLKVTWLDDTERKQSRTISGSDAEQLLFAAVDHATDTTTKILADAASGRGIPVGLATEEQAESRKKHAGWLYEMGVALRGCALILLVVIATACFRQDSGGYKIFGACTFLSVAYLLFLRGWWKDTILTIIDFVKDAIFG